MMAVSLGSSNITPPSSAMPSPPLPPPRSSSLSPGSGQQSQGTTGRSRSSRKGQHGHREVRFGNYILGQTLGEGEFGKVKLGWRRPEPGQTTGEGVQVAIKLIRKESVDTKTRMNKIDREIAILRRVHHPNIVKLCDVIYTDRHIGIILEYASGGELFDYILSHRYLKDHVACKLFAQLISGVSYLHEKGIVHRDLKLVNIPENVKVDPKENLLLDQNRNIIITDFGFANTFNVEEIGENNDNIMASNDNRKVGDLMQTSCGSPCYAAPELVVTDGLYAGRKVDVWSCGVILYAMLAGYLPFDDDPANPEGDNINLLYKYITQTPLTFPEYVSAMARDLLRQILKPKPEERMTLKAVKGHTWLYPHRALFRTPVTDFETQVKESVSHLSATSMGRSVSAHESHHTSYIAPSSSHLLTHPAKASSVSPPSSPEIASATLDPRRHTVQLEYDKPIPTIVREDVSKGEKKVVLDVPTKKSSKSEEPDVSGLGVPPAPALVRSATTGAATPRPMALDTVVERSPDRPRDEKRRPSASSSVSQGVSKPPTARPTMPHGSKPRPTSYHPPSRAGGVPMSKGRSTSGDRTATLLLQRRSSSGSGSSSRKGYNEPSPSEPVSSNQNAAGQILQSNTPPQEVVARTRSTTMPIIDPVIIPPAPPQRSKTHKRASASISMVADKVFGFFTTTKLPSPPSSPQRHTSVFVSDSVRSRNGVARSNTTTRRNPVLGSAPGSTVLARKRDTSKTSLTRSPTEPTIAASPKAATRSPVKSPASATLTLATEAELLESKLPRSRTEVQIPQSTTHRHGLESPKLVKPNRKLGDMAPDKASSGAARRVMEFFRRRARGLVD